jgi:hypothetical protein
MNNFVNYTNSATFLFLEALSRKVHKNIHEWVKVMAAFSWAYRFATASAASLLVGAISVQKALLTCWRTNMPHDRILYRGVKAGFASGGRVAKRR